MRKYIQISTDSLRLPIQIGLISLVILQGSLCAQERISLSVNPENVLSEIDERIYSHFLEHIYHSVHGGLWDEKIWNRSFEESRDRGAQLDEERFTPRYWRTYGGVNGSASMEAPLNSDVCMHLSNHSARGGIQQSPISVVKNETYSGSLWLRGTAPGGGVIRLRAGFAVLDEYVLGSPTESWVEYPFTLTSQQTSQQATIQVELVGEGDVWIDQISLMPETSVQNGGFHPDLLKSLADLRPPVLRWPGGRFVQWYRWKDAIGPQSARRVYPRDVWDDRDINALGVDEFIALCRLIRAEPYIVLNAGTDDSNTMGDEGALRQDALDLLEYCNGSPDSRWGRLRAKYGHPEPYRVKYWEIGDTHPYEQTYENIDQYIQRVEAWSPALKAIDPTIMVIASGVFVQHDEAGALNRRLNHVYSDQIDYLSLEAYERNRRFAQGPTDWEAFLVQLRRDIAESDHPNLKVCVTEWNTGQRDWRGGLYAAGMLNVFERNSDIVALASPALLMRHTDGLAHDNALINFDHRGWFPSAVYIVMKLWRDFYLPQRIRVSGPSGPLNVLAARSRDHTWLNLKMVNPTSQAVEVSVSVDTDLSLRNAGLWLIQARPRDKNAMYDADRITPAYRSLSIDNRTVQSELPAYSVGILTLRQAENNLQDKGEIE